MVRLIFVLATLLVASRGTPVNGNGANRIVGGEEVDPLHSRNYQVAMYINDGGLPHFSCGGSVYDETTIITAAHCCFSRVAEELVIVAGDHQLSVNEGTEQKRQVSEIKMHEDFQFIRTENDICLLKLEEALEMNANVGPVDLPEPFSAPATPDTTVSGWGTTSVDGGLSDVLLQVTIPIVSDEECREDYRFFGQIYDSNMCAGEEGHDHCYGDSGGPLTCGGRVLCGIVSWANQCALDGYPGVNTEVSYFVDWIRENA